MRLAPRVHIVHQGTNALGIRVVGDRVIGSEDEVVRGILQNLVNNEMTEVSTLLYYLTAVDCAVLGAVLLLMSLLIANRYSRHIFTKSAMKAFREGA